jgi:deoxyguanosine kinase
VNMKERRLPDHISFLSIEGVIGVGKTTLCEMIARHFTLRPLLETPEDNPFLSDFYRNRSANAFQTQMWFLLSRHRQLTHSAAQGDLFYNGMVADYLFAKDRIFANLTLDESEMALYGNIADLLAPAIPRPDFVIYLQASTDVLLKRITMRGRRYEHNMDRGYIEALNEAYNHFFFHYTETPLLIVNANEIDFVENPADFDDIIHQLTIARGGTSYYHSVAKKTGAPGDTEDKPIL